MDGIDICVWAVDGALLCPAFLFRVDTAWYI